MHVSLIFFYVGFTVYLVYIAYQNHIEFMHKYKRSPIPSNYSCVVKNIPPTIKVAQQLKDHFNKFFPNQV